MEIELEKKILLTKEEYEHLLSLKIHMPPISFYQINYYYDTDDFEMNRQGITCRIRKKDNQYNATIKKHYLEKHERSSEISQAVNDHLDDSVFAVVSPDIKLQGELVTCRTILYDHDGVEVALDVNEYLGIKDYELEIEYRSESADLAMCVLQDLENSFGARECPNDHDTFCSRAMSSKSKAERFFARLNSIKTSRLETISNTLLKKFLKTN
jgi:uncharacterized protein YjbK